MRRAPVLATVAALTLGFAPAFAQDASIGVKAPSPQRATLPSLQYEATQPSDDNYPLGSVRILYDPAFFTQFSVPIETPTSTGRVGLAGWSTPNPPLGGSDGGFREGNRRPGVGLAPCRGGPPPPKGPPPPAQPPAAAPPGAAPRAAHPTLPPSPPPPT